MSNLDSKKSSVAAEVKGYLIIGVTAAALVAGFLYTAGFFGSKGVTAQKFVDLQQGGKSHYGFRRAHAKGVCLQGEFVANGSLAAYTDAELFKVGSNSFNGRFSIAGNNPLAPDLAAPVRSFALSFSMADGERWRTAMNTPPVMAVRTPEDFYQQLTVLTPDAKTGKRDVEKINAFFQAHPETAAFNQWKDQYQATTSFATEQYHSINAFYLVNAQGQRQAVRWAAVPQATEIQLASTLSSASQTDPSPDALQIELDGRLQQQPVKFDLVFTLASVTDDENDPTIPWPDSREQINAGTLVVKQWKPQQDGACNGINFDPLVLPTGIEPSKDPILNARGAAYAESYRRRANETLLHQQTQSKQGVY